MRFKYKRYGPGILRPVIPVELVYRDRAVSFEVLVDSGADFCIFHGQLAEVLGINMSKGREEQVYGITGIEETYYVHPVTLVVGGWKYQIEAGFLPEMTPKAFGVVGQKGFFDLFIVKFDLLKEEVELKERKK